MSLFRGGLNSEWIIILILLFIAFSGGSHCHKPAPHGC